MRSRCLFPSSFHGGQPGLAVSLLRRWCSSQGDLLYRTHPFNPGNCSLPCPFKSNPSVSGQKNLSGMFRGGLTVPSFMVCLAPCQHLCNYTFLFCIRTKQTQTHTHTFKPPQFDRLSVFRMNSDSGPTSLLMLKSRT